MLTLDKIYQASYALKTVIRRTDLISAPNINPESHIFLNQLSPMCSFLTS